MHNILCDKKWNLFAHGYGEKHFKICWIGGKKQMKYPVYIEKDKDSDFGVLVSDLPGCYSAGSTMEEALTNAEEAILTHLEGLMMDNDPIPLPSKVDELQSKKKDRNGVWTLVEVDLKKHRHSTESLIKWIQNQLSE